MITTDELSEELSRVRRRRITSIAVVVAGLAAAFGAYVVQGRFAAKGYLEERDYKDVSLETTGLFAWTFNATDDIGATCSGDIKRALFTWSVYATCSGGEPKKPSLASTLLDKKETKKPEHVTVAESLDKVWADDLDYKTTCVPITEGSKTFRCTFTPRSGKAVEATYVPDGSEWTRTQPKTVKVLEHIAKLVRDGLAEQGKPGATIDCGKGFIGLDEDTTITCSGESAAKKPFEVKFTYKMDGTANWEADI